MPKLPPEKWTEIGGKYEAGIPVYRLAKEYGVSRKAIILQAKKANWVQDKEALNKHIAEKAAEQVKQINLPDQAVKDVAIQGQIDERAAVIIRHQQEWETVETLVSEALAQRKPGFDAQGNPTVPSFEPFKHAKIIAETIQIKQTGERKAYGLDPVKTGPDVVVNQNTLTQNFDLINLNADELLALRTVAGKLATQQPG